MNNDIPWTKFWDMHSGGRCKEKYDRIYIQAPRDEAEIIFYNRFGHNPNRVTRTCCGPDYSIDEYKDLKQATGYDRGCAYLAGEYVDVDCDETYKKTKHQTVEEYLKDNKDILVIYDQDIKPEERVGEVPAQGYVWVD